MRVSFFVPGTPITSNLVHGKHGNYWREDKKVGNLPAGRRTGWKNAIATVAAMNMRGMLPVNIAVKASLCFYFNRPMMSQWDEPAGKYDLDKVERVVWDALEKIVYTNDARVCHKVVEKVYDSDVGEGVRIMVETYEKAN